MPEPRDPLLKVLTIIYSTLGRHQHSESRGASGGRTPAGAGGRAGRRPTKATIVAMTVGGRRCPGQGLGNDPSAGSPTETLLRLLLPLNDQV